MVLLITSQTYAEIPVLLLTFVVAAILNMGTNFIMGTISFVSNSVTTVLQLALSLDYAVILCNRYKEEHQILPVRNAVIVALGKSIPEITASSMTTVGGLFAMAVEKATELRQEHGWLLYLLPVGGLLIAGIRPNIVYLPSIILSTFSILLLPISSLLDGKKREKQRRTK